MRQPLQAKGTTAVLKITTDQVIFISGDERMMVERPALNQSLAWAMREVRGHLTGGDNRNRPGLGNSRPENIMGLDRAAILLGETFLVGPIAEGLYRALDTATKRQERLHLAIDVPDELSNLPWEAIPDPRSGTPLALLDAVCIYRRTYGEPTPSRPGPAHILVAVAGPVGTPTLQYERELNEIQVALTPLAGKVRVTTLRFATREAIREALRLHKPHVLHVSAHATPGYILLEDSQGDVDYVNAQEFIDEALPQGLAPPMIVLSACHTNVPTSDWHSFARQLTQGINCAVVATESSITAEYVTRFFAALYHGLTANPHSGAVVAVADARRRVQATLLESSNERDTRLSELNEWANLVVLANDADTLIVDGEVENVSSDAEHAPAPPGRLASGVAPYFVGRRHEQRAFAELLTTTNGVMVLHGQAGVGKSSLARELLRQASEIHPLQVDLITGMVDTTGSLEPFISTDDNTEEVQVWRADKSLDVIQGNLSVAESAGRSDTTPRVVILDAFDVNIGRDGMLSASLQTTLEAFLRVPHQYLIITCRTVFEPPLTYSQLFRFHHVPPLSPGEARALIWSLPALQQMPEEKLQDAWEAVGGHPRILKIFNTLSSDAVVRSEDLELRSLMERHLDIDATEWISAERDQEEALQAAIHIVAADASIDNILSGLTAEQLLVLEGASTFLAPVDLEALLFLTGRPDPSAEVLPDYWGAWERLQGQLDERGISLRDPDEVWSLPDSIKQEFAGDLVTLDSRPIPPRRSELDLELRAQELQQLGLLICEEVSKSLLGYWDLGTSKRIYVHRWIAKRVQANGKREPWQAGRTQRRHRAAASYWHWRASVLPQTSEDDVRDHLSARYHLSLAGDMIAASKMTDYVVDKLTAEGDIPRALELAIETKDSTPEGTTNSSAWQQRIGNLLGRLGRYNDARLSLLCALEVVEAYGTWRELGELHLDLGVVALNSHDHAEAQRHFEKALSAGEAEGVLSLQTRSGYYLGGLLARSGDVKKAREYLSVALGAAVELNDHERVGAIGLELAGLPGEHTDDTQQLLEFALAHFARADSALGVANARLRLGYFQLGRQNYEAAEADLTEAFDLLAALPATEALALAHRFLGILAFQTSNLAEARYRHGESRRIFEELGDLHAVAMSHMQLAFVAAEAEDAEEAGKQFEEAGRLFASVGDDVLAGEAATWIERVTDGISD